MPKPCIPVLRLTAAGILISLAFTLAACRSAGSRSSAWPLDPKEIYIAPAQTLDPSVESHWPGDWASPQAAQQQFAAFVHFAETSADWLLVSWRGEAVFIRCKRDGAKIEYAEPGNQIRRLEASGGVEVLSLRRYARCDWIVFDGAESKLSIFKPSADRKNPCFLPVAPKRSR